MRMRRRRKDRIHIPAPEVAFNEVQWSADLARALGKASARKRQNWRQRRDLVRATLGTLRLALADHPMIGRTPALDELLLLEFALAGLNTGEAHPSSAKVTEQTSCQTAPRRRNSDGWFSNAASI